MKLSAVGVTTSNMQKAVEFYTLLGFEFPKFKEDDVHVEPIAQKDSARLMIDTKELITEILGKEPKPSNHSAFAVEYETPAEVDAIYEKVKDAGFMIRKEPWDAFWGQRYCIVSDPDGYLIDLYADL